MNNRQILIMINFMRVQNLFNDAEDDAEVRDNTLGHLAENLRIGFAGHDEIPGFIADAIENNQPEEEEEVQNQQNMGR